MNQSVVVLFMKGTPEKPYDGYQAQAIEMLDSMKLKYSCFDVVVESDVRELLKEHSRWNAFPQLFIHGKFAGGLNFIVENVTSGRMTHLVPTTEIMLPLREKIQRLMNKGTYMVFMNGRPLYPTCQNSRLMMDLFRNHYPWVLDNPKKPELALEHFDLSKEKEVQLMLFQCAKYAEVPQFYCDGKLVGGLELLEEMHEQGELLSILLGEGAREHPDTYLHDKPAGRKTLATKKKPPAVSVS